MLTGTNERLVVVAATNRPRELDDAALRRFQSHFFLTIFRLEDYGFCSYVWAGVSPWYGIMAKIKHRVMLLVGVHPWLLSWPALSIYIFLSDFVSVWTFLFTVTFLIKVLTNFDQVFLEILSKFKWIWFLSEYLCFNWVVVYLLILSFDLTSHLFTII